MEKKLFRSRSDRMIWGVCGGLAKYFDIDPTIVRIVAVLLLFANGVGILAYIILAIVVPLENSKTTEPKETIKENLEEIKETASDLGREVRSTFVGDEKQEHTTEAADNVQHRRRNIFGVVLIIVGILLLLASFNLFWWMRWDYLWPLIIVAIGLVIILSTRRK